MKKYLFLTLSLWILSLCAMAQQLAANLESLVTINQNNTTIGKVLADITSQTGLVFSYSPSVINDQQVVNFSVGSKSVRYVLFQLFGNAITIKERGKYLLLVKNKPSDDKIYIEGYITEPATGKRLSEVTIYNKELNASAVTNRYGYFKIELKPIEPITQLTVCKSGFTDTVFNPTIKPGFVDISLQSVAPTNESPSIENWKPAFPTWMIPRQALINALNIRNDSILKKTQISFLPFVGTSSLLNGKMVNDYSINILAGYCESVNKFEIGGCLNLVRRDVQFCQLAGVGNMVGGVTQGFQGAGVFNVAKESKGIQLAGVFNTAVFGGGYCQVASIFNFTWGKISGAQVAGNINIAKEITGVQLSGLTNFTQNMKGFQLCGLINYAQQLNGIQLAGVANYAKTLGGIQIAGVTNISKGNDRNQLAGVLNIADTVDVVQISGVLNIANDAEGAQVATILNVADTLKGVQISAILNVAKAVNGMQISLINIADTCTGVPIGIFSFVKKGYNRLGISADEFIYINASYRMGVPYFYSIVKAGISPANNNLVSLGFGFGTLLGKNEKRKLNLEITQSLVDEVSDIRLKNNLQQLYFGIDRKFGNCMSINYGLSLNYFATEETDAKRIDQIASHIPYTLLNSSMHEKLWLGARLEFRF